MGERFNFYVLVFDDVFKEIKKLSVRKAIQIGDILVKILKQNADLFSDNIYNFFSFCVNEGEFRNTFKKSNTTPAFKKAYRG